VKLASQASSLIRSHCRLRYPEEACGVLLGVAGADAVDVREAVACENAALADREHRFTIAPERFLAIERDARARDLDVVGFFHSHPDHDPTPSPTDLERAWPYYVYVIARSGRDGIGALSAHRLGADRARFDREPIDEESGAPA
jgi:proteasome lid subunit RPN8/RPN11